MKANARQRFQWLFDEGLDSIWLSTGAGTRAQRFYERAGWNFSRQLDDGERFYELHRNAAEPLPAKHPNLPGKGP